MDIGSIGKKKTNPYFIPKDIKDSIEKLEKLRDQMTLNTSNTRSKLKEIKNIIISLNKLFEKIKTKIGSGDVDLKGLQDQIQRKNRDLEKYGVALKEKDEAMSVVVAEKQEVVDKLNVLQEKLQGNDVLQNNLNVQKIELENSLEELQKVRNKTVQQDKEIELATTQKNKIEEINGNLTKQNEELSSVIGPLKLRVSELEDTLSQAKKSLETAGKEEIAKLLAEVQTANNEKQVLMTEKDELARKNETLKEVQNLIKTRLERLTSDGDKSILTSDGRIKPGLQVDESDLADVASTLETFTQQVRAILGTPDDRTWSDVASVNLPNQGKEGGKRKRTQRNRRRSIGRRTRRRTKKTRRGRSRRGGYVYGANNTTSSASPSATTSSTTTSSTTTSSSGTSSTASYGNDDFGRGVTDKTYKKRRNGKKAVKTKRRNDKRKRNCKKCNCKGKCRCKTRT